MNVTKTPKDRIVELHNGIMQAARRSVADAIQIGQIIADQKETMPHGEFLPWLEELPFAERTARNYMKLFEYRSKTATIADLQEAYHQIEQIEYDEKKEREQRDLDIVATYKSTGVKPPEWERRHDYLYKKMMDDDEFELRKRNHLDQKRQLREEEERVRRDAYQQIRKDDSTDDILSQAAHKFITEQKKRSEFKTKIKLSSLGKTDPFVDAIMDYLDGLPDDNRRIEACNNIVKVCRTIAVQLHQKQHKSK